MMEQVFETHQQEHQSRESYQSYEHQDAFNHHHQVQYENSNEHQNPAQSGEMFEQYNFNAQTDANFVANGANNISSNSWTSANQVSVEDDWSNQYRNFQDGDQPEQTQEQKSAVDEMQPKLFGNHLREYDDNNNNQQQIQMHPNQMMVQAINPSYNRESYEEMTNFEVHGDYYNQNNQELYMQQDEEQSIKNSHLEQEQPQQQQQQQASNNQSFNDQTYQTIQTSNQTNQQNWDQTSGLNSVQTQLILIRREPADDSKLQQSQYATTSSSLQPTRFRLVPNTGSLECEYKLTSGSDHNQTHANQQYDLFNAQNQTVAQYPRCGSDETTRQLSLDCGNSIETISSSSSSQQNEMIDKIRITSGISSRRGRPRKKDHRSKAKINGKLWEFIRDLLLNDNTNPSFIRWERREDGVFKFVQSDKVAKMWGERKQNPKMTYEKLSRAMRYYYKSKVLLPVFGRRLVYKFGPNATGWLPATSATHH